MDTLITASPEFFKGKSPKEIAAYFQRAADFLIDRVGRENIVSAIVPFVDNFPKDTKLYRLMSTKPEEMQQNVS